MNHTTTEVAAILNLQPKTISRYINRGLITAQKKGRDYFISKEEVERFQRERRKPGQPRKR